ncbi:hypothetical protein ACW4YW_07360, partial [Methylobacillus pratensis]
GYIFNYVSFALTYKHPHLSVVRFVKEQVTSFYSPPIRFEFSERAHYTDLSNQVKLVSKFIYSINFATTFSAPPHFSEPRILQFLSNRSSYF